jgi:hypothetical protein
MTWGEEEEEKRRGLMGRQGCRRSQGLHLLRRQIPSHGLVLEAVVVVAAVAERLVARGAAAAERDDGAPAEAVRLARGIDELQVLALQTQRAVLHYGDLAVRHGVSSLVRGPVTLS